MNIILYVIKGWWFLSASGWHTKIFLQSFVNCNINKLSLNVDVPTHKNEQLITLLLVSPTIITIGPFDDNVCATFVLLVQIQLLTNETYLDNSCNGFIIGRTVRCSHLYEYKKSPLYLWSIDYDLIYLVLIINFIRNILYKYWTIAHSFISSTRALQSKCTECRLEQRLKVAR